MTPTSRLAAELSRRLIVLPLEHPSGVTGVLVGNWRATNLLSDETPSHVRNGTLYCVRDGEPFALPLPAFPCADPSGLDVPSLYDRFLSRRLRGRHVMARHLHEEDERCTDPFVNLAWGVPLDARRHGMDHLGASVAVRIRDDDAADGASEMVRADVTGRLRSLDALFVDRIAPRHAQAMAFMRARLPYFTWGACDALANDRDGCLEAFADRYPLLAGRSLSDRRVVAAAASGDMDAAFEASMDAGLVGRWALAGISRHPALAGVPDGRRRGRASDQAAGMSEHLDRNHVPRDPESFAAYADTCDMVGTLIAALDQAGVKSALRRCRGRWADTLAACRQAARLDGVELSTRVVGMGMSMLICNFREDIVHNALRLASGTMSLPRDVFDQRPHADAAAAVAAGGMGLPDLVRHAVRYVSAKPAIAAAGMTGRVTWLSGNLLRDEMPWLVVNPGLLVRPVFIGSPSSTRDWWGAAPSIWDRRSRRSAFQLPADTPLGCITVVLQRRKVPKAGPARQAPMMHPDDAREALVPVLMAHYGCEELWELGNAIVARHDPEGVVAKAAKAAREGLPGRLEALRDAWGAALPRRLRRLAMPDLAAAVARDHAMALPATFAP